MHLPATSNLLSLILATEDYQRRFTRRLPAPAGEDDRCESGMDALAAVFGRLFPPHSDDFTPTPSDTGEQSSPERTEQHHDVTSTTTYSSGAPMEHSDSPLRTPLPMPARIGSAVIALIALFAAFSLTAAAQIYSFQTGNWHDGSTWVGGVAPTALDDVVIDLAHTVTVNSSFDEDCNNLTVTGTLLLTQSTANNPLDCHGSLTVNGILEVDLNTATLNVFGPFLVSASGDATHTSGTIYAYNWTVSGTYTPDVDAFVTIPANAPSGKSINGSGLTFTNLEIINSGTVTASSDIEITNDGMLYIGSGSNLNMQSNVLTGIDDANAQTGGSGVLITTNGGFLPIPMPSSGSYSFTVNYAGSDQFIVPAYYDRLTLSGDGTFSTADDNGTPGDVFVRLELILDLDGAVYLEGVMMQLGIDVVTPGTLTYTKGHFYGDGKFRRMIPNTTPKFDYGDMRGYFPMGDGVNNRSLSISTMSATFNTSAPAYGAGWLSVAHTTDTAFADVDPAVNDAGFTINRMHMMSWEITDAYSSSGGLRADGVGIRVQASGINGLWSVNDLRLFKETSAPGTHGGTAGTVTDPQIIRTGLKSNTTPRTINGLYYIGTNVTSNPLPVELTSFSARMRKDVVNLNWTTATELNNFGFEIYRSNTGSRTDDDAWTLVGFVNGHGTSLSPKQYSFDDVVGATSGSIFYRLKQIDRDGTAEYSKVVSVNPGRTSFALSQNYPNPFSGATAINYSLESDEQVTLQVYDIMGNLVSTIVEEPQTAGNYVATFDPGSLNLKPGNYILRLTAGNFVENRKMVYVP